MRAALYRQTGSARETLSVEDVDAPEPGPGQVRVRVHLSAVNPTDYKARSGATPRPIDGFQIPHQDGVGVVDMVGEGVDADRVGQRVWLWLAATTRWGTAAEYSVVEADQAVPLPEAASDELGACLGVPAMTAQHCLGLGRPVSGTTVVVTGGAGAVGHFAIELARYAEARVIATVSNAEKAELARAAGADAVVDYRHSDAAAEVGAVLAGQGLPPVERIVEVALSDNLGFDLAVAAPGALVVSYAATGSDPVLPVRACMAANITLRFVLLYGVPRADLVTASQQVTAAAAAGALTELPIHSFGIDDAVAAHEAAENGVTGKVVLDLR